MKKNLDKLFAKSIETYYFLLVLVVIIKLLGGDYFSIIENNKAICMINDFITHWKLENVWYAITLYFNVYVNVAIMNNINDNKIKRYILYCMPIVIFIQCIKGIIGPIGILIDSTYVFILGFVYLKITKNKLNKNNVFNYITIVIISILLQFFSMIIRDRDLTNVANGLYANIILSLDYFIVLIILYKWYFMKGVDNLCQVVVYSGLQKLTSLKHSLKDLHVKSQSKPKLTKEQKITYFIYTPLYLLWNLFTMLIIIAIAMLNSALPEAIFITISFWINKRVFGKPFHFKSVGMCFCFSSIVYYVLTRITFHIQTSLFIPIFLGVGLSYVTSHFIKDKYKLYKGMSEVELRSIVMKVTDDELVIKICKEYYCDRYTDTKIAYINNYSVPSIRNKRQTVNKKLRNLSL